MAVGLRFRPPWWAVALAGAACVAGVLLGNWQAGRAAEKRALAAARKAETLRGELLEKFTLFLDNKTHRGAAGYYVLQPLRLRDGRQVLVNRGWVAAGPSRDQLPAVRTPGGEIALEGLRLERLPRAFELAGAKREGRVWQNASVDEVAAWSELRLEPWVLEQHAGPEDGLVRDWPRADEGVAMHESYALQWYSLAGLSVVLLVALNLKREKSAA